MSVAEFAQSLYATQISTAIRETSWIIPTVQSLHILSVTIVVGAAIVMDLRLAGVLATDESPRSVVKRHLPWMWAALGMLLATGSILVLGEPSRELNNQVFWIKMALILAAFFVTLLFRYPVLHPEYQIEHGRLARLVKPTAWASFAIWIAVIFCGRWIAYLQ